LTAFNISDPRDIPAYSISEAGHYLGVPTSTLRSWFAGQAYAHRGERRQFQAVIRPADPKSHSLSFSNLVEAYVLTAIRRRHHIGLPTIRRGLDYLVKKLARIFHEMRSADLPEGALLLVFEAINNWVCRCQSVP